LAKPLGRRGIDKNKTTPGGISFGALYVSDLYGL